MFCGKFSSCSVPNFTYMNELIIFKLIFCKTRTKAVLGVPVKQYQGRSFTTGVFIMYLFSFLRSYFCFLRSLNSCDNMDYIFPMCVVGTSPTFSIWLVFMYAISNSPSSTYYI